MNYSAFPSSYTKLSFLRKEICRAGHFTCSSWPEFLSYYRFMVPEEGSRIAQKRAATLWSIIKELEHYKIDQANTNNSESPL